MFLGVVVAALSRGRGHEPLALGDPRSVVPDGDVDLDELVEFVSHQVLQAALDDSQAVVLDVDRPLQPSH